MNLQRLPLLVLILIPAILISQEINIQAFGSAFSNPVNIKHANDSRLFVVEQNGKIKILNADGSTNTTDFLDIESQVLFSGERGLLGLAFHPNYASNGYLYVNYINNSGDTVISRFTRNTNNTADPNSELILLTFDQPAPNHNGGDLAFGADGYLYISTGDGGGAGDQLNNAQNLSNLLGCILRIDVDNTSNGNNYAIPSDNPFIGNADARDEIWSYGLRNPWKFSFDSATNDIWIADVGQSNKEEINSAALNQAGLNYGWRCYEGTAPFNTDGCQGASNYTSPVAEYDYGGNPFKCAIVGGFVYRGNNFPNLQGTYLFADYCSRQIGFLKNVNNNWEMTLSSPFSGNNWAAFGEDSSGELYICALNSGQIYKIADSTLSTSNFEKTEFTIFPNPTKGSFKIQSNKTVDTIVNIYNILGKKIKSVNLESNKAISTANMPKGVYLVEILVTNGQKQTKKLIVN